MGHILIVEDNENLRVSLQEFLGKEGFNTETASDLKTAQLKFEKNTDLVLLDWMLPDGQGLDFLKSLRRQGSQVPIIFLTARAELVDKVLGLELGASDYITKPFESREMLARVRARLREVRVDPIAPASEIELGSLCIDKVKHRVTFNKNPIELVKKEFDLLVLFAESPEKVFSRDEILNKVWGYEVFPTTRTVDTHVLQLRQKIHENLIETVRSVGYRLQVI